MQNQMEEINEGYKRLAIDILELAVKDWKHKIMRKNIKIFLISGYGGNIMEGLGINQEYMIKKLSKKLEGWDEE